MYRTKNLDFNKVYPGMYHTQNEDFNKACAALKIWTSIKCMYHTQNLDFNKVCFSARRNDPMAVRVAKPKA